MLFSSPSATHDNLPCDNVDIIGAWLCRTVKGALPPGSVTHDTSPEKMLLSGESISSVIEESFIIASFYLFEHLLALFYSLFYCSHVEESLFGQIIDLAVKNHIETAYSIFN